MTSAPEGTAYQTERRRAVSSPTGRTSFAGAVAGSGSATLLKQFVHPLALLLWAAAALALVAGTGVVAAAIVAAIFLNALFAFFQER